MFPPTLLTDPQLRDYSDRHLVYEAMNLFISGRVVSTLARPDSLGVYGIQMAMFASFALHLRNVVDFFYKETPQATDVVAAHFFEFWPAKRPKMSRALAAANARASGEVLHLTTERIARTPTVKEWDPEPLLRELRDVLDTFLAGASEMRLGPKARQTLRALADRDIDLNSAVPQ